GEGEAELLQEKIRRSSAKRRAGTGMPPPGLPFRVRGLKVILHVVACVTRVSVHRMKIVRYPHPSLRVVARPLAAIDEKVRSQAAEMLALMYEHRGLALAATQVELPFRMVVMNVKADPLDKEAETVCINPVILERKGTQEGDEGCLSFPELFQRI